MSLPNVICEQYHSLRSLRRGGRQVQDAPCGFQLNILAKDSVLGNEAGFARLDQGEPLLPGSQVSDLGRIPGS